MRKKALVWGLKTIKCKSGELLLRLAMMAMIKNMANGGGNKF